MADTDYLQDINLKFNIEDIDHDTIGSSTFGKKYRENDKTGVNRINDSKIFLFGKATDDSVPPISIEGTIIMIEGKEDRTARKGKRTVLTLSTKKPSGLNNYTHGIQDTISPSILGLDQMITPSFYFDPASRIYDTTAFEGLQSYINTNINDTNIELKDIYGVNCSVKVSIDTNNDIIFDIGIRKYDETTPYEQFQITIDKDGYAIGNPEYISGNKENAEYFSSNTFDIEKGSKRVLCKLLGDLSHLIYLKQINDADLQNKTLICTSDSYLCDRSLYNDVKGVIYRSVAKSIEKVGDRTIGGVKGPIKIKKDAVKIGKKMVEKIKMPRAPSIIKYVLYENYWGQGGGGDQDSSLVNTSNNDLINNKIKFEDLKREFSNIKFEEITDEILQNNDKVFNNFVIGLLINNFKDINAGIKESSQIDLTESSKIENLWTHIKKILISIKSSGNDKNGYEKAFEHRIIFEDGELVGLAETQTGGLNLNNLINYWEPKNLYELTLFMNKVIEFGFKIDNDQILDDTQFSKFLFNALTNDNIELSGTFNSLLTALLFIDGYRIIDVEKLVEFINIIYDSSKNNFIIDNIKYNENEQLFNFLNNIRENDDGEKYEYIEEDEDKVENKYSEEIRSPSPVFSAENTVVKPTNSQQINSIKNFFSPKKPEAAAAAGGKRKTLKKRRTRRSRSKQTKNKKTRRYKKTL